MGNLSRTMSGTPWHVEHYERKEGDERRHKHRCRYYIKSNNFCMKKNEKCMGSAHCMIYEERISDLSTSVVAASTDFGKQTQHIFNSVIYVDLNSIHISNGINSKTVSKKWFKIAHSYFLSNQKLQCPLYVTSSGGSYELTDNYIQYKVAYLEKLQKVPVFIGDHDLYTKYQKAIMNGSTIIHSRYGKGTVIKNDYKYIWVKFLSDKLVKLDTIVCLKNKLIEV